MHEATGVTVGMTHLLAHVWLSGPNRSVSKQHGAVRGIDEVFLHLAGAIPHKGGT